MKIRIKNLRARTIIGINEWEREQKQEIINLRLKAFFLELEDLDEENFLTGLKKFNDHLNILAIEKHKEIPEIEKLVDISISSISLCFSIVKIFK